MLIVFLLAFVLGGCATSPDPWTPERRTQAKSLNQIGASIARSGVYLAPAPFLFPPEYPAPVSFICTANNMGLYTTTTCY